MVIFNNYVKLPEGIIHLFIGGFQPTAFRVLPDTNTSSQEGLRLVQVGPGAETAKGSCFFSKLPLAMLHRCQKNVDVHIYIYIYMYSYFFCGTPTLDQQEWRAKRRGNIEVWKSPDGIRSDG